MKPFVVEDGNVITARYPADAHLFARMLIDKMKLTVRSFLKEFERIVSTKYMFCT